MQRDIVLLTLSAALGLMGLNSGAAPIDPFPNIGTGAKLVVQDHPKESEKPWYNCTNREIWDAAQQSWCQKVEGLKNAKYQIPGIGQVQLKNGTYTNPAESLRVVLIDKPGAIAFGDLNNDGKEDATVLLGVSSGGSEALTYLSVVVSKADNLSSVASIPLGDRIKVQAIAIHANHIKVDLVQPGASAPYCCPTQTATQFYRMHEDKLSPLLKPYVKNS
ncbi:hypothetical protein K9N68_01200 [Kovacikia minuta CCNUW1]|uniref:hypothetical protein n=1 Tax=Kovacikia minuta TaxID=2931930 RepID=UPI001CCF0A98|nr:hypothetical protein [Kovacikia minuta]UBF26657.1 hypothetical protein K9N68_01200 [Kovacikia minuta CCNUW1]